MVLKRAFGLASVSLSCALSFGLPAMGQDLSEIQPPVALEQPAEPTTGLVDAPQPLAPQADAATTPAEEAAPAAPQIEVIRERYPNRAVKVERHVMRDSNANYVEHGPWVMFDERGDRLAFGEYKNGERHGKWTRVHFDKKLPGALDARFELPYISTATFVDGKLDGVWTITDVRGRKVIVRQFAAGQLHGASEWYYANGRLAREEVYKESVLDGVVRDLSPEGKVIGTQVFEEGCELARHTEKYPNGSIKVEGQVMKAKSVPVIAVDWWAASVKTDKVEKLGVEQKQGTWTHYYADGGKQFEHSFKDDVPVGVARGWFENGQLRVEGTHAEGKRGGVWTWYHPNGSKYIEGKYTAGVQDGRWIEWAESGKVKEVQEHTKDTALVQVMPATENEPAKLDSQLEAPVAPKAQGSSRTARQANGGRTLKR